MDINQNSVFGNNTVNINNGLAARVLDQGAKDVIDDILNEAPVSCVHLNVLVGDSEILMYGDQVRDYIKSKGFQVNTLHNLGRIHIDGQTFYGQAVQRSASDPSVIEFFISHRKGIS